MNVIQTLSQFLQEEIDGSPDVSNTLQDLSSQIHGDLESLQGISQLISLFVQKTTLTHPEREWLIRKVLEKSQALPQFKSKVPIKLQSRVSIIPMIPPPPSLAPPAVPPVVLPSIDSTQLSNNGIVSNNEIVSDVSLVATAESYESMAKSMTVRPPSRGVSVTASADQQMRLVEYDRQELLQDLIETMMSMLEEHIKMTPKIRESFLSRIDHSRHRIEETLNHYGL